MSRTDIYKKNLQYVKSRILKACDKSGRNPEDITVVTISKTHPVQAIRDVHALGQVHFGENKVQELMSKMDELESMDDIKWHMVGALQTNKIKYLVKRVDWIHSVPKLKALKEINKRAGNESRTVNTLIQVNISDEDQKSGCEPEDLPGLIDAAESMTNLRIMGLMGIAEFVDDPEIVRPQFRLLRELLEREQSKGYKRADLRHLSMGMTHDLEVAIEEGATMVRIGTAIFGERDYS